MNRRSILRHVLAGGITAGVAGCLGMGSKQRSGKTNQNVVLPEPEREFDSTDVPYPAWGERIPDVTLPAPLEHREVTLQSVDKPQLLTFFYSSCPTVCPVLIASLGNVQSHALENGYGDQVAFFPITFDPARDTADTLRQYGTKMPVDADAGNWHFLRPTSEARAKEVVQQQFGVSFQKATESPTESQTEPRTTADGHHNSNATKTEHDHSNSDEHGGHDHGAYEMIHTALTLLVNENNYVERAYRTKSPNPATIVDDLETVRKE